MTARLQLSRGAFSLDVALSLPVRGVTGVFGPSGCGKTTLLRCLAGLERAAGTVQLGNELWQDERYCLPAHRRQVGMVFQDTRLFPHLTVAGNLRYAARRSAAPASAWEETVANMGLEHLLARRPCQLSGGEAQRVAVARALLGQPRLLLLDEPLAALDNAAKQEIMPYLERVVGESALPVIYVTHSLDEVTRLAEQLVLMQAGRIVDSGRLTEMLSRVDLPLAHREDVGAVLEMRVTESLPDYRMSRAEVAGYPFYLPDGAARVGGIARVRIRARDVSITLAQPGETSILNVLPGQITHVVDSPQAPGQCLIRIGVGDAGLLAWVSTLSRERLGLCPGQDVYAQVKAVALA